MQNDTSKFLVNIIPLQNIQTNVSGTNANTVMSNSIVALQQMVNTDTKAVRTNTLQSFTSNATIGVLSGLNLSNVGITSNDQPFSSTGVFSTITAGSGTFSGICYAQQFVTLSDITAKTEVREWRSPILSELGKIHPYIFNYTDKSKDIGLMAQEVEAILPQLVKEGVRGKYVNYDGVVGLLVKGVQELSARVSTLEGLRS